MGMKLGNLQLRIMRSLWERGEATARQITDDLSGGVPSTLSTVQTLLRKLETKGAVGHEQRERTFFFRPLIKEQDVARSAAQDLLARVYDNSLSGLLAHLLEDETVSAEELRDIKELIEAREREMTK